MSPSLKANGTVLRVGHANHFIDEIGMKGKMTLTNEVLHFDTHKVNFRQYDISIPLTDIADVRLKHNLKIFPYGVLVTLTDGSTHRFAVWGRMKWVHAIKKAANLTEKS